MISVKYKVNGKKAKEGAKEHRTTHEIRWKLYVPPV